MADCQSRSQLGVGFLQLMEHSRALLKSYEGLDALPGLADRLMPVR
jgi:hypothetical protein